MKWVIKVIALCIVIPFCGYGQVNYSEPDSLFQSEGPGTLASDSIDWQADTSLVQDDSLAQVDSQKVVFMEGVSLYNSMRYYEALKVFQNLSKIPMAKNHYLSAAEMMLVKTHLRLGQYDQAIATGYDFESFYEESDYMDDVRYSIAEALLSKGKTRDAMLYYMNVLKVTDDDRLRYKCRQAIDTIVDLFLSVEDLKEIEISISGDFYDFILHLKIAEKYFTEGDEREAKKQLSHARHLMEGELLSQEYMKTSRRLEKGAGSNTYVGVILPLSGSQESVGHAILNGVRYAVHRFRENTDRNLAAIVMDNRDDMVRTIKLGEYLSRNPKVKAIFGPVSSENAIALAALANQIKIPMITPTATHSDLTELGPYTFQANVDFENLGYFLGKYSTLYDRIKTVATLSPVDEYGKDMTDAFSKAVDENGGRIISQQWYGNKPEDLKLQFRNIRKAGLELHRQQLADKIAAMQDSLKILSQVDSLWQSDSLYLVYSDTLCHVFVKDTIYRMTPEEALVYTGLMDSTEFEIPAEDSLEYEIQTIQGLFMPVHANDLDMIVPQLAYYNLETTILGSGNWNDPQLYQEKRNLLAGIRFISDYYIDPEAPDYKYFALQYADLMGGGSPGRFELYGYDTMQALLKAFRDKEVIRSGVQDFLSNMPIYAGLSRNISFQGNRPGVNSCAFILTFEKDTLQPVAVIKKDEIQQLD